ncbi:transcriptional repressor [Pseudodesulfovibrio sp. JC047]|uniref:Fur family transcriptional regulator n=1 Tax=Pseudodesulfovibrio sp. JC047 TaxID=2683199 RepID=UPI0013D8343D|nr:transcriptional repressor [Pseudodesulfovibrio sp. JC047]NDV18652.1 transcriptional repressor [Pseudodesulfovibrio sp. JC047]
MSETAEHVFAGYLGDNGLAMTPQRRVIVETFLETEGHFSAEELYALVRVKSPEIGQATVYRTLKLLVDSGLADALDLGDGGAVYEHAYGHEHHDHLICVHCGKNVEICDDLIEDRQEQVATEHGFQLSQHRMYLYGVCDACQGQGNR